MRLLFLFTLFSSILTFNSMAQIQMESLDMEVPQLTTNKVPSSGTGPLLIVKIDSIEYKLDSISAKYLDAEWIQSVEVHKDKKTTERYGPEGEHGVALIRLKKDHIKDFITAKEADTPIKAP